MRECTLYISQTIYMTVHAQMLLETGRAMMTHIDSQHLHNMDIFDYNDACMVRAKFRRDLTH